MIAQHTRPRQDRLRHQHDDLDAQRRGEPPAGLCAEVSGQPATDYGAGEKSDECNYCGIRSTPAPGTNQNPRKMMFPVMLATKT